MKLTIIKISNYLHSLQLIEDKVAGKLGYFVARNIRLLSNELTEFEKIRTDLIYKYGTQIGEDEYKVLENTSEYVEFSNELQTFFDIEHDVNFSRVPASLVMNSSLTAKEINNIFFMIEEE